MTSNFRRRDLRRVFLAITTSEFTRLTALCGFLQANGSGYGICNSCRSGALGGAKK